jgi:hypothetical protein
LNFVQQLLSALEVRLEVGQIADFKRSHGGDISYKEITDTDFGIQTSIAKLIDHLTQLGNQQPALWEQPGGAGLAQGEAQHPKIQCVIERAGVAKPPR